MKRYKNKNSITLMIFTVVLLAACTDSSLPGIGNDLVTSKPPNQTKLREEFPFVEPPTPGKQSGVIVGRLISSTDQEPITGHLIYLGEFLYLTPGPDYLITLQIQSSNHVLTNDQGIFIFPDVEPAQYPLILWSPGQSLVIPGEDVETEILVNVEAGKTIDLGDIYIVWP